METSMMPAIREPYVDMGQARNFRSSAETRAANFPILGNGSSAKLGWQVQDYNAMGAAGNASISTAAKGRAILDAAGLQLARLLDEVSRLPLSTLNPTPNPNPGT